jgi:hypothetical protein
VWLPKLHVCCQHRRHLKVEVVPSKHTCLLPLSLMAWPDVALSCQVSMLGAAPPVQLTVVALSPMQPIFLQSFETFNLKYLRPLTDLPLVQLTMGVNVSLQKVTWLSV